MLFSVLVWAAAVVMVFLGRWQLVVSDEKHFDWQNFGYALQWWVFSAAAVAFWAKLVRDALRGRVAENTPTGGELVLRGRRQDIVHTGPATLVTRPAADAAAPVVYRGYVMPQSATSPDRSDDDPVRASYNDYLWQLALADGSAQTRPQGAPMADRGTDAARADDPDAGAGTAIEGAVPDERRTDTR